LASLELRSEFATEEKPLKGEAAGRKMAGEIVLDGDGSDGYEAVGGRGGEVHSDDDIPQ
jgi:hypothetical protein